MRARRPIGEYQDQPGRELRSGAPLPFVDGLPVAADLTAAADRPDEARPAVELCRIAEQLEQTYPGLVKARVVTAERYADHPAALGDPTRSAHRQYGVEGTSAFVVRPDKYIGYRGRPVDLDRLTADLDRRLVAQHLSDQERQFQ